MSCKGNCGLALLFICGVCLKMCIKISKLHSWGTFTYYFHGSISFINTETKGILTNTTIQVLKDMYFLDFTLKSLKINLLSSVNGVSLSVVLI